MATNKDQLKGMLKTCYKKAISKENFFELLRDCELATYVRSGKITGVVHNNKKHRLGRLGFTEEILQELNKPLERGRELKEVRKKSKEKGMNR